MLKYTHENRTITLQKWVAQMSYACVVIANSVPFQRQRTLIQELNALAQEVHFPAESADNPPSGSPPVVQSSGLWLNPDYYQENELLPADHQDGTHLIFEVCDWFMLPDGSAIYSDVCQALLMPDGHWYCDHILGISVQGARLAHRVQQLARIFAHLNQQGVSTEIYLGDDNAIREDYQTFHTSAAQAETFLLSHCMKDEKPTLHLIITHENVPQ